MAERFLTVAEVAALLQVHPQTVRLWMKQGTLKKANVPGRAVRIPESELARLISRNTEGEPKPAPDASEA